MKKSIIVRLIVVTFFFFYFWYCGYRDNGSVIYYGQSYTAGSVLSPDSYISSGLFPSAGKEINELVSKKRHNSLVGMIISASIGGFTFFTLWHDDDFKDMLVESRRKYRETR